MNVVKVVKLEKVVNVSKRIEIEKEEKLTHSIKVSIVNSQKLTAFAGELQMIRKVKQTPNDAITRLFEIKTDNERKQND